MLQHIELGYMIEKKNYKTKTLCPGIAPEKNARTTSQGNGGLKTTINKHITKFRHNT